MAIRLTIFRMAKLSGHLLDIPAEFLKNPAG
jgi:hypothetical protein